MSEEKTRITHIKEGFDFLSINLRKYNGKYLPKPSKESVKHFLGKIREIIKTHPTAKTENLIQLLNPKIRGWTNYHRHNCAKKTFGYIRYCLFHALWRWAKRRHPNKGKRWIKQKYFRCTKTQNWIFSAECKDKCGKKKTHIDLYDAAKVPITRYVKIKGDASPFKPEYKDYFKTRLRKDYPRPNSKRSKQHRMNNKSGSTKTL